MQLKEFSLINPKLEASLVFQAIKTVISPEVIAQELEKSNSVEKRQRKLPASLVVCLVMFGNCDEFVLKDTASHMVIRFDGNGSEKSS